MHVLMELLPNIILSNHSVPGLVKFSSLRMQTKARTLLISRMYRTVELFKRITEALSSSKAATSVSSGRLGEKQTLSFSIQTS